MAGLRQLVALALFVTVSGHVIAGSGRGRPECGMEEPDAAFIASQLSHLDKHRRARRGVPLADEPMLSVPVKIVAFHRSDGTGTISNYQAQNQIAKLNAGFSGTEGHGDGADTRIRWSLDSLVNVEHEQFWRFPKYNKRSIVTQYATDVNRFVCTCNQLIVIHVISTL